MLLEGLRVIKARSRKATSIQIVAQMDELFGIDAQARQEGLSQSDRQVLRFEKSKPLLEQIKVAIQAARTDALSLRIQAVECSFGEFRSHRFVCGVRATPPTGRRAAADRFPPLLRPDR